MKTKIAQLFASLFAFALVAPTSFAQDEVAADPDNTSYEAPEAASVTYNQPVTYYANVVYQAPVIYNAPVYYVTAAATAAAVAYAAPCPPQPPAPASMVVVTGGRSGTYSYTSAPANCAPSQVIQFGHRGGWGY